MTSSPDTACCRGAVRLAVARLQQVGRVVSDLPERVDGLFKEAMGARGYYRHHREWRRGGSNMSIQLPGSKALDDVIAAERVRRLIKSAGGDADAVFERFGGRLAGRVRERLVKRLSDDPAMQELIRRDAEGHRRELEGEKPTVMERLVVERVLVTWLSLAWADVLSDAYGSDLGKPEMREVAAHVARMRSAANRDHLAALRACARIRKAVPSVTVNVNAAVKVMKKGRGAGKVGGRLDRLGAGVN